MEKRIMELEAENARLKGSRMAWVHRCLFAEESERRQKYKRCKSLAAWCASNENAMTTKATNETVSYYCKSFYMKRASWWGKWNDRWRRIAEVFKEEPCLH